MPSGVYPRKPAVDRFWELVDNSGECWTFGRGSGRWYGALYVNGKGVGAHRFAWELANGPVPDGLWVLHRCDNPRCVNPAHLFLGTNADNCRDKSEKGRTPGLEKTHCLRGHEYTEANTYWVRGRRKSRQCRECNRQRAERFRLTGTTRWP